MRPERVASFAQLAMLLELSSTPKPGNVDRCHDFPDIKFSHFLASSALCYPVFCRAARGESGLGSLILEAVTSWRQFGLPGNTHFGEVTLLVPLVRAAGMSEDLRSAVAQALRASNVQDSLDFYQAFAMAGARVSEVEELSLSDSRAADEIRQKGLRLLDLMRRSEGHDQIAREWAHGYRRCFDLAEALEKNVASHGLNEGVVLTFLEALADEPDGLITSKHGPGLARQVQEMARSALKSSDCFEAAEEMDRTMLERDINPGSTADLLAAALFISLWRGLRF
ncbi:MAG TPA: triphosphoribosyl-dephospho-CoA synthase [Methanotrichaceae archaeon]|nr:MAG: triphosphoribosyl-dephospho-CoA synthase [Methanosaeta sp. PtaU1.Bin028]HOT07111.1 triphosphoribosyl-dephospho-CoA synthase [Methanotrichaceae archaeon]HQF17055.1 triphosphoribosyl-dephospho-CoA synthase [Methanotrichaceae archaeon]HQI91676.1 triphosphoribosyl-dephospho-CoA synthase [Methanotrichaceae archaeon]HQJ29077.1 triphosphoribosyl-dephospho-CoA synthase [Methanotrichaceae archaeon]